MSEDGWLIRKNITESIKDCKDWSHAWTIFCDTIKVKGIMLSDSEWQIVKDYIFFGKETGLSASHKMIADECLQSASSKLKKNTAHEG